MVVTLFVDSDARLETSLPRGLGFATAGGEEVRLVLSSAAATAEGTTAVDLAGDAASDFAELAARVRALLDARLGAEGWRPRPAAEEDGGQGGEADPEVPPPTSFTLELVAPEAPVESWLRPSRGESAELLVAVGGQVETQDAPSSERRRQLFARASCELVYLRPGEQEPVGGGLLVTAAQGPHARAALRWGSRLEQAGHGALHALVVQQDIGPDSHGVGRRKLDSFLARGLEKGAKEPSRWVVLDEHRHVGIQRESERLGADLILLGSTKSGALGQRLRGSVALKVMRAAPRPCVAIVRAAIPITGRTQRLLAAWLQRTVPQLERDSRLSLVERVQSNSHWDFDFMTLISLSTLIAAAGLVANSASVIIGAMLVAPLMTPIMGVGLALVQGNPPLLRMALRSVGLGFLNAFALGVALGWFQPGLSEATPEMLARGWPGFIELFVAFVAGLAGVYASSRTSLIAALPGVAIAAALVPPIATSGVAFAIGDYHLAAGASLLFLANFVAIVLASTFGLYAVGLRTSQGGSRLTRVVGAVVVFSTLALAVAFSLRPAQPAGPQAAPEGLLRALQAATGPEQRVIELALERGSEPARVELLLGGLAPPTEERAGVLREAAEESLGQPVLLRLRSTWERELAGAPAGD